MAVRREVRLRKEFLYRKQQERQNETKTEKKRKLKDAIDEGKSTIYFYTLYYNICFYIR